MLRGAGGQHGPVDHHVGHQRRGHDLQQLQGVGPVAAQGSHGGTKAGDVRSWTMLEPGCHGRSEVCQLSQEIFQGIFQELSQIQLICKSVGFIMFHHLFQGQVFQEPGRISLRTANGRSHRLVVEQACRTLLQKNVSSGRPSEQVDS